MRSVRKIPTCACGEHAWVILTRGHVAIVDPEFAPALGLWNWKATSDSRGKWYATRTHHQTINGKRQTITVTMHRTVLPVPHGWLIDHENQDTLDNRRRNLRAATTSINAINAKQRVGTTSRYRGVSRAGDFWRAVIGLHGRQKYLGKFESEDGAAQAYDKAAKEIFGELAPLNFPDRRAA